MKQTIYLLAFLALAASCQYFETEKKTSDSIYREEAAHINWKDVDRYPLLVSCSELEGKEAQRNCFAAEVSRVVQQLVNARLTIGGEPVRDTVYLDFFVSEKAEMLITEVDIGPELLERLPELEELLLRCPDSLKLKEPAYKRGIPVKTRFRLPVVVQSAGL